MYKRSQSPSLESSRARTPEYDGDQEQQPPSCIAGVGLRSEVRVARFKWRLGPEPAKGRSRCSGIC